MVPTVKWIRKGFAAENPKMAQNLYEENIGANEDSNQDMLIEKENDQQDFDGSDYDREESLLIRDLPTFVTETNKANVKFKDEYPLEVEDSSDDEENYMIKSSDCILIAAKIEEESSSLEIYVYEEEKFNLYVHHEIMLNSYPVALEWLYCDFKQGESDAYPKASLAIVGLMNSVIEIWDLDVLETVEPTFSIDGKQGHKDSITNLALHPVRPNILVSSSADKSIKFWDLQHIKCVSDYSTFKEGVQNIVWDLTNESTLYAYSSDNVLKVIDARSPKDSLKCQLNFGIENFALSSAAPGKLFISTDEGSIRIFDIKSNKIMNDVEIKAHSKAATSILCNKTGKLISNSLDGTVAIYDVKTFERLAVQKTDCDKLFGSSMHPDSDNLFACGSSIGEVVIWDFTHDIQNK